MTGQCDHWVTYPQSNTLDSIFPQREKKQKRNKEEEFLACEGARLPPPFLICPFILHSRIGRYNEVIMESIKLNDLLQLTEEQIANTKIRFMTPSERIGFNPNRDAEDLVKQDEINLRASVYNREKSVSFKEGVIAIGFIRIDIDKDLWLMTGVEH